MNGERDFPSEFATMAAALGRVASLARAARRGPIGTGDLCEAIEGSASVALRILLSWTERIPGSASRQLEARIRACLGYGDRALLGSVNFGHVVEIGRRYMESE